MQGKKRRLLALLLMLAMLLGSMPVNAEELAVEFEGQSMEILSDDEFFEAAAEEETIIGEEPVEDFAGVSAEEEISEVEELEIEILPAEQPENEEVEEPSEISGGDGFGDDQEVFPEEETEVPSEFSAADEEEFTPAEEEQQEMVVVTMPELEAAEDAGDGEILEIEETYTYEEDQADIPETPASSFKYSIKNGKCTITGFKGKETRVSVPAEINGAAVTAIAKKAFYNAKNIEVLRLPEGLLSIESLAFQNCAGLYCIRIPASVSKIASDAFKGCKNYHLVVDENSWAFNWCLQKDVYFHLSGVKLDMPSAIALSAAEATLGVKETLDLAPVDDLGGREGFTFASSNTKVATVNSKGVITAKKAGKATITVRTANYVKAECSVVVKNAPSKITLSDKNIILYVGQDHHFQWTLTSKTAGQVTFSSDNDCVTIGENGLITAVKPGTAKVTATTFNKKKAACTVNVYHEPYSVWFEERSLEIPELTTVQVVPSIPEDSHTTYTYESSKPEVASVDENGLVTALKNGWTQITVTTHNGEKGSCTVTVKNAPTVIDVPASITLGLKEKHALQPLTDLGAAYADGFTFKSSKPGVAAVDSATGEITAKKAGTANITVSTYNGAKAVCKVVVKNLPKSIAPAKKSLNLYEGQVFMPQWKQSSGYSDRITLATSDEACVSIGENGAIIANGLGTATITATTSNRKTAKCTVTVIPASRDIVFDQFYETILVGNTLQLNPQPEEGTGAVFIFGSNNKDVATVDENGLVTAVGPGECQIHITLRNKWVNLMTLCNLTVTPAPTAISMAEKLTLGVNEKQTLQPESDIPGYEGGYTFKSSNSKIAVVDSVTGEITGKKAGTATITATAVNGVQAKCKVTVKAAPKSVSISSKKLTLYTTQTAPLSWKLNSGAVGRIDVSITGDDCITLDENGVVTAVAAGKATITAKAYNGKSAKCEVTVLPEPGFLKLNQDSLELYVLQTAQLKPEIDEGAGTVYTYASSDESVAAVDENGLVTAVNEGEATITAATHNGKAASCTVKVLRAPTSIDIPASRSMGVKEKYTLQPSTDLEGYEGGFTYKSSKGSVASVTADGVISAKKAGTATITVRTFNGAEAQCKVTVKAAPKSISLNVKSVGMVNGGEYQLSWKLSSKSAGSVTFSSSDESIAVVDANGLITGMGVGTAKITAKTFNGKKASCTVKVESSNYSITSMRTEGDKIYATVSTAEACTLFAEVLSESGRNVVFSVNAPVEGGLQLEEVSALTDHAFPQNYRLRAVLKDENGKDLCSPYTTRRYTASYKEFEQQTPEDFDSEKVLDFGDAGFGVLDDGVITGNTDVTVNGDEYSFIPSQEIHVGDIVLLDGVPVKVGAILSSGARGGGGGGGRGRTHIRADRNVQVQEVYSVVNVDGYLDVAEAKEKGKDAKLRSASVEMGMIKFDIPVGSNLKISPELGAIVRIKLLYDKIKWGKDYFETEYYVEVGGKVEVFIGDGFDTSRTFELLDIPLPIATTGLFMDLELNVPVKAELKLGGTVTFDLYTKKGGAYTPDMGKQKISSDGDLNPDFKFGAEFLAEAGVGVSGGFTFLDDAIRVAINGEVGLKAKGESNIIDTSDKKNEAQTAVHACFSCVDITASVYSRFYFNVASTLNKKGEDKEIGRLTIVGAEIPFLRYYHSIINAEQSVFKGKERRGFGECPNNMYRMTVYTVDEYGKDVEKIPLEVKRTDYPGLDPYEGNSTWQGYLYPGTYTATGYYDADPEHYPGGFPVMQEFTIEDRADVATLNGPAFSLQGYVVDAFSEKPIPGASVSIAVPGNKTFTYVTDEDGFYYFRNLKGGDCTLFVAAKGYEDKTIEYHFEPDSRHNFEIALQGPLPLLEIEVGYAMAEGSASMQVPDPNNTGVTKKVELLNKQRKPGSRWYPEFIHVRHEDCAEDLIIEDGGSYAGSRLTALDMGDGDYTYVLTGWLNGTRGGSEIMVFKVKNGKFVVLKEFSCEKRDDGIYVEGKFTTAQTAKGVIYPTKTKFTKTVSHAYKQRIGKEISENGTGYIYYELNKNGYYDLIFRTTERCHAIGNYDVVGGSATLYTMEKGKLVLKKQWYE